MAESFACPFAHVGPHGQQQNLKTVTTTSLIRRERRPNNWRRRCRLLRLPLSLLSR